MIKSELRDFLSDNFGEMNYLDRIELIKTVIYEILQSPKKQVAALEELIDSQREKQIDDGRCPECDAEMKSVVIGHETTEAWGIKQTDPIYANVCPACGWRAE